MELGSRGGGDVTMALSWQNVLEIHPLECLDCIHGGPSSTKPPAAVAPREAGAFASDAGH